MHELPGACNDTAYRIPVTILAMVLAVLLAVPAAWAQMDGTAHPAPAHAKKHNDKKSAHHAPKGAKQKPEPKRQRGQNQTRRQAKAARAGLSGRVPGAGSAAPRTFITLTAKDQETFAEAMKAVTAHAWPPRASGWWHRTSNPILKKVVDWSYMSVEPGSHVPFAGLIACRLHHQ